MLECKSDYSSPSTVLSQQILAFCCNRGPLSTEYMPKEGNWTLSQYTALLHLPILPVRGNGFPCWCWQPIWCISQHLVFFQGCLFQGKLFPCKGWWSLCLSASRAKQSQRVNVNDGLQQKVYQLAGKLGEFWWSQIHRLMPFVYLLIRNAVCSNDSGCWHLPSNYDSCMALERACVR